jgi:hypothetical protein
MYNQATNKRPNIFAVKINGIKFILNNSGTLGNTAEITVTMKTVNTQNSKPLAAYSGVTPSTFVGPVKRVLDHLILKKPYTINTVNIASPVKFGHKFLLIKLVLIRTENNKTGTAIIKDNGPQQFLILFPFRTSLLFFSLIFEFIIYKNTQEKKTRI